MSNLPSYLGASLYVEMEDILNASLYEPAPAPAPPAQSSSFNSEIQDILNISRIENDGFVDPNEDYYVEVFYSYGFRTFLMVMEILVKLVFNFIVFVTEIYLAYAIITIIRKFKQSELKCNVYILTCCLITIVSLAKTVLLAIFYTAFRFNSYSYYCLEEESQIWLLNLYIIIADLLGIDWLVNNNYLPEKYKHFYNTYWKIILSVIHILHVVFWLTGVIMCHSLTMIFINYYYIIIVISCLFITSLCILKCLVKRKNEFSNEDYKLYVSCIILYSYLPSVIYIYLLEILPLHRLLEYMLWQLLIIPEFIETVHPLIIIYILVKHNKYYKMSFDKISCKKSVTTEHEPIEEDDIEQQLNVDSAQINVL